MSDSERDLVADLATCNRATPPPWHKNVSAAGVVTPRRTMPGIADNDAEFIAAAREGWPAAIRMALAAKERIAKLEAALGTIFRLADVNDDESREVLDKVCWGVREEYLTVMEVQ